MAERLRLNYPLRPFFINQKFAGNIPCVKDFGLPSQKIVDGGANNSCPPGYTKLYAEFRMAGHNGIDLYAGEQPVYAACDGIVIEQQTVPARGLGLGILTDEPVSLDAFGTHYAKLRYWHLKSFTVKVGQHVKAGDQIGITDNTGYSSADHLHFELDPVDKDRGGHPVYVNPPGSIAGSIDPAPFFTGIFADTLQERISLYQKLLALLFAEIRLIRSN
jgi:murein DD-endopeptidase MepM/ murein hydrolase activator NlpD